MHKKSLVLKFTSKHISHPPLYLRQSGQFTLLQNSFGQYESNIEEQIFSLNFFIDVSLFKSNGSSFHFAGKIFYGNCERNLFLHFSITMLFVLFDTDLVNIFLKLSGHLCTMLCIKILQ